MSARAVTAAPVSSVCLECGTMQKSGKISCCGRGGSWFGRCGSAENSNLAHTWYEGIRACKTRQSQAVVVQQLGGSRPKSNISSHHASMSMNSKAVIVAALVFVLTPGSTSTPLPRVTPVTVSANEPISTPIRTSIVYNPGARSSKTITETTITFIHTSANTSTRNSTIPLVREGISTQASPIIINCIPRSPTKTPMTTSSDTSTGASFAVRKSSHFDTQITMVLLYVYWYQ